jgi:hypothetical protein
VSDFSRGTLQYAIASFSGKSKSGIGTSRFVAFQWSFIQLQLRLSSLREEFFAMCEGVNVRQKLHLHGMSLKERVRGKALYQRFQTGRPFRARHRAQAAASRALAQKSRHLPYLIARWQVQCDCAEAPRWRPRAHFICAHAASSGRIPRPGTLDVVVTLGCALLRAIRSLRPPQPGVVRAASGGTGGAGKPELPE